MGDKLTSSQELLVSDGLTRDAIVLQAVTRTFTSGVDVVTAVQDVGLRVGRGEFVCILGASGSGKTTLLNLLAGLDHPGSGSVQINGRELAGLPEGELTRLRLKEIGVIFQDHNLIEEFTALENVMLPLEVAGLLSGESHRLAGEQLAGVGLAGLEDRLPSQLSGGQKQRVGIARALVGGRQILLADEPTGALDSVNSRALFDVLRGVCERGACVVLATHDPLAQEYVDTVYTMNDGHLTRTR